MVLLPPFDLHVLGLPLAFILSQDQTLHCKMFYTHAEHGLMSSAESDSYLTSLYSMLRLVVMLLQCRKRNLTICLFQSFKERVPLPIEVTVWAYGQLFFFALHRLLSIWECKGKKNF